MHFKVDLNHNDINFQKYERREIPKSLKHSPIPKSATEKATILLPISSAL